MGTHPIFESDFDCLTDSKMSFLRRSTGSLTKSIRQIVSSKPVKENAVRSTTIGVLPHLLNSVSQAKSHKSEPAKLSVSHISTSRYIQPDCIKSLSFSKQSLNLNGKVIMSSDSSRIAKMFASFDLSSISISFAGMMGDFAVWAICDTTTGEITYLVDDGA